MVLSMHNGIRKSLKRLSGSPHQKPTRPSLSADTKSNVKVVVRIRPENEREKEQTSIVKMLDENVLVFDPKEEDKNFYFRGKKQRGRDLLKKAKKDLQLTFDRVFDGDSTNEEVFQETTNSIIDGLLNGYNCSVFAYGATGAGKTYTMLGSEQAAGITFLTVMELYKRITEMKDEKSCSVAVQYLEVYNETIRDLLVPGKALALREDPQQGVVVSGLSIHKPVDANELLSLLHYGNKNRTQHPTDANAESSRSHAVFIVYVQQQDKTAGLKANIRVAKMVMIDLAGSERATVSMNSGARLREGANINKSLLALGNCINSLADKKTKGQHIPYRDSKLTRLLKDSLGGNCQTVMIAAVSPSSLSYEDTYNTLRYATRAKAIKSHLKKNVMNVDVHITKYVKIVADLRKEIVELKEKLKSQSDVMEISPCQCGKNDDNVFVDMPKLASKEGKNLRSEIQKVFSNREKILCELLDVDVIDRQLDLRILWRRTNIEKLAYLSKDNTLVEKSTQKADHAGKIMERKRTRWLSKRPELINRLQENDKHLKALESNVDACTLDVPKLEYQNSLQAVEFQGAEKKAQHLEQSLKMLEMEMTRSDSILCDALKLIRHQQLVLTGHGYLSSDLVRSYEELQKQVEGCKEVAWADQETTKRSTKHQLNISRLVELPSLAMIGGKQSPSLNSPLELGSDDSNINCQSDSSKSSPEDFPATPKKTSQSELKTKSSTDIYSSIPNKVRRLDETPDSNLKTDADSTVSPISPQLSSASTQLLSGIKNLGLQTANKEKNKLPSANFLFDPPLFNANVKKCLTDKFKTTNKNLNETLEQPEADNIDATLEKSGSGLNSTFSCTQAENSDPLNETVTYTKPHFSFADAVKSPSLKKNPSTSAIRSLRRTPLSVRNSVPNLKSVSKGDASTKRTGGLKRTNSMHHLKSETNANPKLKKHSSVSILANSANRTSSLRSMAASGSESINKLKNKLITDKKMNHPFRRFL